MQKNVDTINNFPVCWFSWLSETVDKGAIDSEDLDFVLETDRLLQCVAFDVC